MKALLAFNQLREFLEQCRSVFASKKEQEQNDLDIDNYVISISEEVYNKELAFDTTEIV